MYLSRILNTPEQFIATASLSLMSSYIATNSKAIANSVKQAKKNTVVGRYSILQHIKPKQNNGLSRIMRRLREKFLHESYAKKKRRKDDVEESQLRQISLTEHVSRHTIPHRQRDRVAPAPVKKFRQSILVGCLSLQNQV